MKVQSFLELLSVNIRICLTEIWTNKARSFITSLGIFLGVASLLVNISFIRAMDNDIKQNLERIGGLKIITITKKEAMTPEESRKFQRSPGLELSDAHKLASQFSYIKSILPQIDFRARARYRTNVHWAHAFAVSPNHLKVYNYEIGPGTPFTPRHHARKEQVCIIGQSASRRLFGNENPLDKTVWLRNKPFTVTGIIHTEDKHSWRARQILIPFSSYNYLFQKRPGNIDEIALEISQSDLVTRATQELHQALVSMHRGVDDIEISANHVKIEEMKTANAGINVLLGSIALISLLVGGISIMNIMFATIGDRIREIGIRKALGAQGSDILTQFIIEAIMLCLVGGIPGMALGAVITLVPAELLPIKPLLTISDYALGVGFTLIVGVLSGLFPALKAAGMQPVDALRY
ncbi:MAG: ABC transporter permease [Chitinispirillaceae bacterium]